MDLEALKVLLKDPQLKFGERLKIAVKIDLVYWDERKNPPNLPVEAFKNLIELIDDDAEAKKWTPRNSDQGTHAHDGEDDVFHYEFTVSGFGGRKTYYVKGFFFEKNDTRGVEIQTFRDESNKLLAFSTAKK